MNNRHIHLFNFLIHLKSGFRTPQSKTFDIRRIFWKRSNKNWIWGWGACEIWENSMLILLISAQKSYFCYNYTIYDVIVQEMVRKLRHNHRHEISSYPFAELPLFQTNSTICIFRQIDRANFAVRGPSSLCDFIHYFIRKSSRKLYKIVCERISLMEK